MKKRRFFCPIFPIFCRFSPFFVDFHHFLSIFTIFCRFSPFFIDFHDLRTFVAIYAIFFFGQNSLLRNITLFLHVCVHPETRRAQIIRSSTFMSTFPGHRSNCRSRTGSYWLPLGLVTYHVIKMGVLLHSLPRP